MDNNHGVRQDPLDEVLDVIEILRKAVSQHEQRLRRLEADADLDGELDFDEESGVSYS